MEHGKLITIGLILVIGVFLVTGCTGGEENVTDNETGNITDNETMNDSDNGTDECMCPEHYAPVCGVDGETYPNECFAECEDVEVAYEGKCEENHTVSREIDECMAIKKPGNYNVTKDLKSSQRTCILLMAGNVTINGKGHVIKGPRGTSSPLANKTNQGIMVLNKSHNTIRDLEIKDFFTGIYIRNQSKYNTVENVTMENMNSGISVFKSDYNEIDSNEFKDMDHGVSVYSGADNNVVSSNTGVNRLNTVKIINSTGNLVENNSAVGGEDNIVLHFSQGNIISSNTVKNGTNGISLVDSHNNTIKENNATLNIWGIMLENSTSNEITENNLVENGKDGISLIYSSNYNEIQGNTVCGNGEADIDIGENNTGNTGSNTCDNLVMKGNGSVTCGNPCS